MRKQCVPGAPSDFPAPGNEASEPHTSELNRDFYYYLSYVVLYVFDNVI